MAPLSRSAFRSLLGGLSREAFRGFVADLWAARGWDVDADGPVVVVADPDTGEQRRLFVRHDAPRFAVRPPTPPADVDAVVRSGTGDAAVEADVVDADDLYGMALYAVDREAGETLFEAYFDRPPTDSGDDEGATAGGRRSRPRSRRPLVVGVAVLLVLAVLGAGVGVDGSGTSDATATPTPGEVAGTVGVDAGSDARVGPPMTRTRTATPEAVDERFPPGLSETGVTNVSALAEAHAAALSGRPYRMVFVHRESVDGRPTGYRQEIVSVASLTRYRSEVLDAGETATDPLVVADAERYANGSVQFTRRETADGVRFEATPLGPRVGREPFSLRSETYVRWFLSVEESRVSDVVERDGRTYFWLTFRGDPWPGVENTTGTALVSSSGVVHVVHRRYTPAGNPNVTVEVTVRVTSLDDAEVTPPAWYEAARRETTRQESMALAASTRRETTPSVRVRPGP